MEKVQVHRTWVQLIVARRLKEIAAIAVDSDIYLGIEYHRNDYGEYEPMLEEVVFDVPVCSYDFVVNNEEIRGVMEKTLLEVVNGHVDYDKNRLMFSYRIRLMEIEEGWQNVIRDIIVRANENDTREAPAEETDTESA